MAAQIIEKCEAHGPGWLAQGGALTSHKRGGTCKRCQKPFTGTSPEQKYCSGKCQRAQSNERAAKRKAKARAKA